MKLARLFTLLLCCALCAHAACAQTETPPECRVALRILTSPEYIKDHLGEIPDADKLDDEGKVQFVADLFNATSSKAEDPEQFCANTVRSNLSYSAAYHFPQQCLAFLPLLKKSFEDKISFKKDIPNFAQQKMNDAILEMLVLEEIAPEKLVQRCEVGIKVMQVDLGDKHLKQKYPLPVTCEVLFDAMEKTKILPSELDTIRRQRVIFAIENKDTPDRLNEICAEISK